MSKQSIQKAAQGYVPVAPPKCCSVCKNFAMTTTETTNNYGTWIKESNLRCTIGGFAVKKMAVCLLFISKEK